MMNKTDFLILLMASLFIGLLVTGLRVAIAENAPDAEVSTPRELRGLLFECDGVMDIAFDADRKIWIVKCREGA